MENWLSIAVAVYLIGMILYGHYKGFIKLAVSLAAVIAALVIVNISMPAVTKFVKENTSFETMVSQSMKEAMGLETGGEGELGQAETQGTPSDQRAIIESLNLPQSIKEDLLENNNNEIYQILGVDQFADYIGSYLSDLIVRTVGFVILFIVVYVVIRVIMGWLDLIARLPVLSGMNKVAGAVLGGVQGLIFLWIFCLVVTAFSGTSWGLDLMTQIEASPWLLFLYNNNFLNVIIAGVLQELL